MPKRSTIPYQTKSTSLELVVAQSHVKPGDLVISKKAYGQDSLMLYYHEFLKDSVENNKELQTVQDYFIRTN